MKIYKMREILFRGKRIDNDEWVCGSFIQNSIDTPCIIDYYAEQYGVYKETVQQYTGLKDKNGNKIFEGDILQDEFRNNYVINYCKTTATFRAFKCIDNDIKKLQAIGYVRSYTDLFNNSTLVVTGNIHDK